MNIGCSFSPRLLTSSTFDLITPLPVSGDSQIEMVFLILSHSLSFGALVDHENQECGDSSPHQILLSFFFGWVVREGFISYLGSLKAQLRQIDV